MMAYSASHTPDTRDITFDTDSFKVGIDTCTSATMFGNKDLFEDLVFKDLGEFNEGGELNIADIETLAIKMENDNGQTHLVQIPNSLYVPNLQMTLLCPQHWAQQDRTSCPWSPEGTV